MFGVFVHQQRLVCDVESDHRELDPGREDPRGSLGIGPDVELGGRRDVSEADRAAHQHDPLGFRLGVLRQEQRDVRERADRHERRPVDVLVEEVDRMLGDRLALRRRQVRAVEPSVAVDVCGDKRVADERTVGAAGDGDVVAADEVEHPDRVGGRLLERLVAGDGRHAEELELGAREREQQRDRIVVPRVAVEQDRLRRHRGSPAQAK